MISQDGKQIGVFSLAEAITMSEKEGLDLVLVSLKAQPPVIRLDDLKKVFYLEKKKERQERREKKKGSELKEVRISFQEAQNDLERKANQATIFLNDGGQVQVRLSMRGRQRLHLDLAETKLKIFLGLILTPIKFVQAIKKQPNFLITTVVKDRSNAKNENKNEKIDSEKIKVDQIK
ncbi:MAG: translation initiation factor IF-3 [Patescibacteria group bacterium]|nr:translation initiation factor IF-3 [Patescibacteria group bacterium]